MDFAMWDSTWDAACKYLPETDNPMAIAFARQLPSFQMAQERKKARAAGLAHMSAFDFNDTEDENDVLRSGAAFLACAIAEHERPTTAQEYAKQLVRLMHVSNHRAALDAANAAIEKSFHHPAILWKRAQALRNLTFHSKALESIKEARTLEAAWEAEELSTRRRPNPPCKGQLNERMALLWIEEGEILLDESNFASLSDAEAAFESALALKDSYDANNGLGRTRKKLSDRERNKKLIEAARIAGPILIKAALGKS